MSSNVNLEPGDKRLPKGSTHQVSGAAADDTLTEVMQPLKPRRKMSRDKMLLLLLGLPGALALVLFHYLPLLGNVIAFQDYQPISGSGSPVGRGVQLLLPVDGTRSSSMLSGTLDLDLIQAVFVFPVPLVLALL